MREIKKKAPCARRRSDVRALAIAKFPEKNFPHGPSLRGRLGGCQNKSRKSLRLSANSCISVPLWSESTPARPALAIDLDLTVYSIVHV
jgi:hypothetical protein